MHPMHDKVSHKLEILHTKPICMCVYIYIHTHICSIMLEGSVKLKVILYASDA